MCTWSQSTPSRHHATCAGLMRYPDRPTAVGYRLVPEIAQSAPSVSSDGRRYTFVIRPGYRFSPPSGAPVTAQAFKYSIERALSPRLDVASIAPMQDVVGMAAYASGRAAHIAGVIARGDELTIVLRRPSGDLAARLSAHDFCPVPIGTPVTPRPGSTIPYAGPDLRRLRHPGTAAAAAAQPRLGRSAPTPRERDCRDPRRRPSPGAGRRPVGPRRLHAGRRPARPGCTASRFLRSGQPSGPHRPAAVLREPDREPENVPAQRRPTPVRRCPPTPRGRVRNRPASAGRPAAAVLQRRRAPRWRPRRRGLSPVCHPRRAHPPPLPGEWP